MADELGRKAVNVLPQNSPNAIDHKNISCAFLLTPKGAWSGLHCILWTTIRFDLN